MSSARVPPPRATTMYGGSTASMAPVPLPRPKSEHSFAPQRSLPPPPSVASFPAASSEEAHHHPSAPPKRPVPRTPSQYFSGTQEPPSPPAASKVASPPKRTLPLPFNTPVSFNGADDKLKSTIVRSHKTGSATSPLTPARPTTNEHKTTPSSWHKILPDATSSHVLDSAKSPERHESANKPRRLVPQPPSAPSTITSTATPMPAPVTRPKPQAPPSPPGPPAPPALPRRPTISTRHQSDSPVSETDHAAPTSENRPTPASRPAPPPPPPPPLPSRSDSIVLKRIQNMQLNDKPPALPSKPPRTVTSVATKTSETTAAPSPTPPTPPPRPTLPMRPKLPARPTASEQTTDTVFGHPPVPNRPALPARRPTLPERPALPKRPQSTVVSEQHSSHESYSQTRASVSKSSTITTKSSSSSSSSFSSTASRLSSSASSFINRLAQQNGGTLQNGHSHPSTTLSPPRRPSSRAPSHSFQSGHDDSMAIVALSVPVTTDAFHGEPMDYTIFDFSEQDQHAEQCPAIETQSIARLSHYLTSPFVDDKISQLRVIFTWIAKNIQYNMTGFMSGQLGDNSAETVLRTRTGVCAGFANLFLALSEPAHLGVLLITGDAKGFGFKPGERDKGGAHAWNAVEVNGEWRLIDSTWASGDPDPCKYSSFTPYYFLVPPQQHIYSHLPSNPDEQFLDPPVSQDLYLDLPALRWSAWSTGIRPTHPFVTQLLRAEDDFVELDIRVQPQPSDGRKAHVQLELKWPASGTKDMIGAFWCQEDAATGDTIYSYRFYCPSGGTGELNAFGFYDVPTDGGATKFPMALTYKVVNEGDGRHYSPPIMICAAAWQVNVMVVEPWTLYVTSGVQQTIRVQAIGDGHGKKQTLYLICNNSPMSMFNRPMELKQVEPGMYEMTKALTAGQYYIGFPESSIGGMGIQYSMIASFTAR